MKGKKGGRNINRKTYDKILLNVEQIEREGERERETDQERDV